MNQLRNDAKKGWAPFSDGEHDIGLLGKVGVMDILQSIGIYLWLGII